MNVQIANALMTASSRLSLYAATHIFLIYIRLILVSTFSHLTAKLCGSLMLLYMETFRSVDLT